MWFGYNPQINLSQFFRILNLVIFSGSNTIKLYRYWALCMRNSCCSFMPTFLKLYMCFYLGLKMCMWFRYNPKIIFVTCFHFELGHISVLNTAKVYRYLVPCVPNSLDNFMPIFLKLYRWFCHGLKMCMWFGYTPQIIFFFFFFFFFCMFDAFWKQMRIAIWTYFMIVHTV